jgi:AmiR/NasT family two-component response regulator
MSGPTSGPWAISAARTVEGDFMVVAGEGHNHGLVAEVLTEGDAKLIASLPALVAERDALRKALEQISRTPIAGYVITDQTPAELRQMVSDFYQEFRKRVDLAKKVLASTAPANRDEPTQDTTGIVPLSPSHVEGK